MSARRNIARAAALLVATLMAATALEARAAESTNRGKPLAFRLDTRAETRNIIRNLPAHEETSPLFGFDAAEWLKISNNRELFRANADLDGDGTPELILMAERSDFCGTSGCETIILKKYPAGWRHVATFKAHRKSFALLPEIDLGWRRFFNGEETYLRIECGYTTQEDIDEEAARGHGPCDTY